MRVTLGIASPNALEATSQECNPVGAREFMSALKRSSPKPALQTASGSERGSGA